MDVVVSGFKFLLIHTPAAFHDPFLLISGDGCGCKRVHASKYLALKNLNVLSCGLPIKASLLFFQS